MRRAISPATCTQVTSAPSRVRSQRALRSLESDALSSAALRKAPGKYQRSFTVPSTGERLECTLNTFMNTDSLIASRSSQGSRTRLTSTMRPSAGETTARGSSGTSRGGARKNCSTKSASNQNGSDQPQPMKKPTARASATASATNGQPSRAITGCGYGGFMPLVLGGVDEPVLADPRHHLAQPGADLLDRQLGGHAPLAGELRRAGAVLQDELARVLAGLNAPQRFLHALAHALVDDLRPGDVLAVFGVVRDRIVHGADAALVHEVDDQLQLVQALEVRHLRRVARLHQRVEAGLHELDAAAAEHRLLAEEVGLGLLLEGGLDYARLAAADGRRVGKREVARLLRAVAVHGDQHRHAAAAGVGGAHGVPGRLRRHHPDVEVLPRLDQAVMDVEAGGEGQRGALLGVGLDVVAIDLRVVLVGQEDHDDVGALNRLVDLGDLDPALLGLVPRSAVLARPDGYLEAGILQVLGMRVPLGAVTHDGDLLALDERKVGVLVVIDLHAALPGRC